MAIFLWLVLLADDSVPLSASFKAFLQSHDPGKEVTAIKMDDALEVLAIHHGFQLPDMGAYHKEQGIFDTEIYRIYTSSADRDQVVTMVIRGESADVEVRSLNTSPTELLYDAKSGIPWQAEFARGRLDVKHCRVDDIQGLLHAVREMDFYSFPSSGDVPFNAIMIHGNIYRIQGWRRGHEHVIDYYAPIPGDSIYADQMLLLLKEQDQLLATCGLGN